MFGADVGEATIDDFRLTCIQFINEISGAYREWVERYSLSEEERNFRLKAIDQVVGVTNDWIEKYGDTMKKIDIIKEDGINKMAEFTAGYPFQFIVTVGEQARYVHTDAGRIRLDVLAKPREDRKVRITRYNNEQFVLLRSSAPVSVDEAQVSFEPKDVLNEPVFLDASSCKPSEIISVTIVAEEVSPEGYGMEKRGLTTMLRIK